MTDVSGGAIKSKLTVVEGQDTGRSACSRDGVVTVGGAASCDLRLTDIALADFSGALTTDRESGAMRFVVSPNTAHCGVLTRGRTWIFPSGRAIDIELADGARLSLGETVLKLDLVPNTPDVTAAREDDVSAQPRDHIVRRVSENAEELAQRIASKDDRLQALFRLVRRLNQLNSLDAIIAKVAEVAFEIFPLASFFAVVVPDVETNTTQPPKLLFGRDRTGATAKPIISRSIVRQVLDYRETILFVQDPVAERSASSSIVQADITACLAAPLVGQRDLLGVMQVDSRGGTGLFTYEDLDLFAVLASSVAFAMERAKLSRSIYEMFEAFVEASVTAIEARDPNTAGHSERVANYALRTAEAVHVERTGVLGLWRFSPDELTELRYAALLHDFGKIGVTERVLHKPSRLLPDVEEVIIQRLDAYEQSKRQHLQRALLERLVVEGRAPLASDVHELDEVCGRLRARVRSYRQMVKRLQSPQSRHATTDHQLIEEMLSVSFSSAEGRQERLLYEDEATDLRIVRGTLNELERAHIQSHAQLTEEYLQRIPWSDNLRNIPCIAGRHHEKLDGSGYPQGLPKTSLIPQVRILTVADIFDALTAADRPYRKAQSAERASWILSREAAEGKLDETLVDFFITRVVPTLGLNK